MPFLRAGQALLSTGIVGPRLTKVHAIEILLATSYKYERLSLSAPQCPNLACLLSLFNVALLLLS